MNSAELTKEIKEIKKCLDLIRTEYIYTEVFAVAICDERHKNDMLEIPLSGSNPINHYVHNLVRESYMVEGNDYFLLTTLPFSYQLSIADWEETIPIPEPVILKYLSSTEKEKLEEFRAKYKAGSYLISYLQATRCV